MGEPMKNMYNREVIGTLAADIQAVYSPFDADGFLAWVVDESWPDLELKDRIYKISRGLGAFLPQDYREAIGIIDKVAMNYGTWLDGFAAFFPIFVELYGQKEEDLDVSIAALARYTPYASSEIAVRPFIIKHEERMMAQMYAWTQHEDECVRRLASEGCRPALPWAMALNSFKRNPAPVLPILEALKDDPSLHVRKSVANNLNDISKTHPDLVAALAADWYGKNEKTDWIVKHGCRTLLKKGNRDVLALFGFGDAACVEADAFALGAASVHIGESITFAFTLRAKKATRARLEYAIDYMKANGKHSRKIFQISELSLKEKEEKVYTKAHSFADVSTRRHYPGHHSVTLIVNGAERGTLDFEVLAAN